jgi:hypothetical protein
MLSFRLVLETPFTFFSGGNVQAEAINSTNWGFVVADNGSCSSKHWGRL